MIGSLRDRNEWKFAGVLPRADLGLAVAWWAILILRGLLPAVFAIAMGWLVGTIERGGDLARPLGLVGVVFVLLQVLSPFHQAVGANLGSRTAAWLYDQLATTCVTPPGMGHLENPGLTNDLTMARDFDLAITGPPLFVSMNFIASGLVEMVAGLAAAAVLAGYAWWAPILLAGAWLGTHWFLRESGVWRDRNTDVVRDARAMPTTRTAWRSIRRRPRSCGSLGWPTGSSSGSARAGNSSPICSGRRRGCASVPCSGACSWCLPPMWSSSGRWGVRPPTDGSGWAGS